MNTAEDQPVINASPFEVSEDDKPVPMSDKEFYAIFLDFIDK